MAYSIYIHLPFCLARCSYCDFFSTTHHPIPFQRYREAVLREWKWRAATVRDDDIVSIYLGGGTPSLWPAQELIALVETLPFKDGVELTVEVNPGDGSADWFESLVRSGVNRFSIGAQALDESRLKWLGRRHSVRDVHRAFEWAAQSGVKSLNGDLIYGTPGMTRVSLERELCDLVDAGASHVSAYELTLAPGTPLRERLKVSGVDLLDEDLLAELWHEIEQILGARGLLRYEVSNYAKPGRECRHNQHYWRTGFYVGLGAGAHGFQKKGDGGLARYANIASLDRYMSFMEIVPTVEPWCGIDRGEFEEISHLMRVQERVMLGLRTTEGVSDFADLVRDLPRAIREKWQREVHDCQTLGLVISSGGALIPTREGMLNADSVAERFF